MTMEIHKTVGEWSRPTSTRLPVDTGRKLNVHKTFRRHPRRILNVLCTFNLRPVSTGLLTSRYYSQIPIWYAYFVFLIAVYVNIRMVLSENDDSTMTDRYLCELAFNWISIIFCLLSLCYISATHTVDLTSHWPSP